jgi:hypothetical protein
MSTPQNFDLTPYHIQRPEKIRWRFPIVEDLFAVVKSKTTRSFLRNVDRYFEELAITWEYKTLDKVAYLEWLKYYQQKIEENNYEVIANEEWYDKKKADGKEVTGFFFYRNGQLIGSSLFVISETGKKAVGAFKANDRIEELSKDRNSLGAAIDLIVIRYLLGKGVETLSFGQTRNAFGVINAVGNLDYKLRFGMVPSASESTLLLDQVPLTELGSVVFFGIKDGILGLYGVKPKDSQIQFEQARFNSPELPFRILEY